LGAGGQQLFLLCDDNVSVMLRLPSCIAGLKVARSAAGKKMVVEVAEFIARRTAELEKLSKE
jgi:hypothetical protein